MAALLLSVLSLQPHLVYLTISRVASWSYHPQVWGLKVGTNPADCSYVGRGFGGHKYYPYALQDLQAQSIRAYQMWLQQQLQERQVYVLLPLLLLVVSAAHPAAVALLLQLQCFS